MARVFTGIREKIETYLQLYNNKQRGMSVSKSGD